MLGFIDFLIEDASARSRQDSMGKLHELLVSKHLYGGKFPEYYADSRGTSPIYAHDMHAKALFDPQYSGAFYEHPEYKRMDADAKKAAGDIRARLLKEHGITDIHRVAWTSQDKDVEKEIGIPGAKSKSDVIVTGAGKDGKPVKVGLNLKVGKTKEPNYANPGVSALEQWSGVKLSHHVQEHSDNLDQIGRMKDDEYKAKIAAGDPSAVATKASSDRMHLKIAADVRSGFSRQTHKQLRALIQHSTAPESAVPMLTSHTINHQDGSSTHRLADHEQHINGYLDQFDNLHANPNQKGKTVTIYGIHKKTGKKMPVWRTTIYAGGESHKTTARGMVKLPSESNDAVLGN